MSDPNCDCPSCLRLGQFCEEILAKAIMDIQQAAGVRSPFDWDDQGRPKVSGAVAEAFWGADHYENEDTYEGEEHALLESMDDVICRSKREVVEDHLTRFLVLQIMDGDVKPGPFCLRVSGTRDYVSGWNVDPVEFDASKKEASHRALLGVDDFAQTESSCAHPDILVFTHHIDVFLMARLIERLDGTHMSVEDFALPEGHSCVYSRWGTGDPMHGTPASLYSSPQTPRCKEAQKGL